MGEVLEDTMQTARKKSVAHEKHPASLNINNIDITNYIK